MLSTLNAYEISTNQCSLLKELSFQDVRFSMKRAIGRNVRTVGFVDIFIITTAEDSRKPNVPTISENGIL